MAGFKKCEKCVHGCYLGNPYSDYACIYIIDTGHSRDTSRDTDKRCADYIKRKEPKRLKNICYSPNATPIREKSV